MSITQVISVTFDKSPPVPFGELSLSQLRIFAYEYARRLKSATKSSPDKKPNLPEKKTLDIAPPEKVINLRRQKTRRRLLNEPQAKDNSVATRVENAVTSENQQIERCKDIFAAPLEIDSNYSAPEYPKNGEELDFLDRCMRNNFVFNGLSEKEKCILIIAMEPVKAAKGELIVKQGEIGGYFYVIQSGGVSFEEDGCEVSCGWRGASFGELALLHDSPLSASVRAEIDCSLFRVDQKTFRSVIVSNKEKAFQEGRELLKKAEFLSHLDDSYLSKISEALATITFRNGDVIIRKGDKGDVFYIIKRGKVRVSDIGHGESKFEDHTLECGDCFGERALLTDETRAANITSVGDSEMFCLTRDQFEKSMGSLEVLIKASRKKKVLNSIPIFADAKLEPFEIDQLVSGVEAITFRKGDLLSRAGDVIGSNPKYPHGIYCITHNIVGGEISTADSSGKVNLLRAGDYFGVRTIKAEKDEKTDLDIVANANTSCTFIAIEKIKLALKSIDRLGTSHPYADKLDSSITMATLKKHTILGSGTFGQVWLVSDKRTSHAYALKIQSKRELIKHGQPKIAVREKNLMTGIDSQFVIKLFNAFQDKKNVFMVMSLVQGGELFSLIHDGSTNGISERDAKFYTACILEGLCHMHRRHIVYRDLKPDNVMIGKDGYCVLIDLGFAKAVTNKTYTLCGTPLYLAPEVILHQGYDKCVDFWSFGTIIYEMLFGHNPFYSKGIDQATLFKRIIRIYYSFPVSSGTSEFAQDLISNLLVTRPRDRMGCRAGGTGDVRNHLWLRNIVTEDLHAKKIKAPWVPNIKSSLDVSYFDDFDHLEDKQRIRVAKLTAEEQSLFENF